MRDLHLTPEEQKRSYAKYFDLKYPVETGNLVEYEKGEMDPAKTLSIHEISKLLDPGYHDVELGYCRMPDGTGYVAHYLKMPGITPEMFQWWFAWHALEDARYMIWCPMDHGGVWVSEEGREKILNDSLPLHERYMGVTHHNIEKVGDNYLDIQLSFLHPEEAGFDMTRYNPENISALACANIKELPVDAPAGTEPSYLFMMHTVRCLEDGIELRSRYWQGWQMVNGVPVKVLPDGQKAPMEKIKGCAFHNVFEYSRLRGLLPDLYREMQGRIEV